MGGRWNPIGFQFLCFLLLIFCLEIGLSCSVQENERLVLLEFRARVSSDPHGAFANWNPKDDTPCSWLGVYCVNGQVQMLDLSGLSVEGTLGPELGKLSHLKSLVLNKNRFSGAIPKEFGALTKLEVLDLRENNLSGTIPADIGKMLSLKRLLLCDNKFEASIPWELRRLNMLSELQYDENLKSVLATEIGCVSRKFGHCIWQGNLKELNMAESLILSIKGALLRYLNALPLPLPLLKFGKDSVHDGEDNCFDNLTSSSELHMVQNVHNNINFKRRRLLEQQSSNLAAAPASDGFPSVQIFTVPNTRSSGAFPAVPHGKKKPSHATASLPSPAVPPVKAPQTPKSQADDNSTIKWNYFYIIPIVAIFVIVVAAIFFMFRKRGVTTIGPWKTGLSGQLQKAFVTGVPKLNRHELETACEDFSNIIDTFDGCVVYKGTLSSGVEIAVASTSINSLKDWSTNSEMAYRKKIDMLSQVNHKNFVNLIGYCEEDEPFNRMMVFEYAPNGTLFEHLHVEEMEHLDWNARMRVIMGTAYCLQYMHHDLNPPVSHSNLNSTAIYLTDDYASKIAEIIFSAESAPKSRISGEDDVEHFELPSVSDPEINVYSFGILLLEIISGKLPYSEEQGPLVKWAAEYLNDKKSIGSMIDPTLKSFKNNELEVISEVIQDCIQPEPRQRPTMKEVTSKLREVINITPDQATPRLSPLWWAELEILSVEAT
ncbi:LRR_1 domain-containing protein/Pkinase_Tyr domain-containing protein/LRRNT_2 domain-containing protein [Cephalotus follicularis]|uniref:LRR_1 domain-containing protein/Pkinase_Tyr domain-containing protein/LRRNT_2 domain-containing protein n=1 Tax=Cephalotus follicularis TaxID=3775 RepID=A0A1Q3BJF5_CEPFO|nr:LRR_1 domain-containing protein/Pkinase_Tyr domain-containing protein/LRRNT_2 domain-containing protein [Cephalotus follicularis]